jgi:alpha-1,6-mannosyltransferase
VRIVQLANFYTPTSGGLRTCLEEIGRGYLARGHERTLIVPGERDLDEWTAAGRRIYLASPRMPAVAGYRHLVARRRVCRLLDQAQPDILEVSDKLSIPWLSRWARRNGVPIVLFSHERIDAMLRPWVPGWVPLPGLADLVNRRLCRMVDAVVVASAFAADEFHRVGAANITRIALGVDLSVFSPAIGGRDRADRVRLVTVGRLSREKSPENAIECLRLLRAGGLDAELVLIGDGPLRMELERQGAGLPVRFIGHVPGRDTLAGLLADADIALAPCGTETFGLAVLEALACGTPVVVPAGGAAHELIQGDGSGIISDGTVAGLAAAVHRLRSIPAAARRGAAREVAERYPWSATVTRLLASHELRFVGNGAAARAGCE